MILRQPECALHDLTVVGCMCPSSSHLCGCPPCASVCALRHLTFVRVLCVPLMLSLSCDALTFMCPSRASEPLQCVAREHLCATHSCAAAFARK